jgi:hypothetical protein
MYSHNPKVTPPYCVPISHSQASKTPSNTVLETAAASPQHLPRAAPRAHESDPPSARKMPLLLRAARKIHCRNTLPHRPARANNAPPQTRNKMPCRVAMPHHSVQGRA